MPLDEGSTSGYTVLRRLDQGEVPSPTVDPSGAPLPTARETPVRVCMQQTGQTRRQCLEDIRRSNGLP